MQGDKGILFRKTTYLSNSFHTITYGSVMDMSEFKRWISYIYAYNGEIKGKNVGFAKIEARDGKCRLNISIKGAYGCDTRGLDVGLFVRRSGRPVRFSAGPGLRQLNHWQLPTNRRDAVFFCQILFIFMLHVLHVYGIMALR